MRTINKFNVNPIVSFEYDKNSDGTYSSRRLPTYTFDRSLYPPGRKGYEELAEDSLLCVRLRGVMKVK